MGDKKAIAAWILAITLPLVAAGALIFTLWTAAEMFCHARDNYLAEHPDSGWQRCR
jgi:hypothetical protein